MNDYQVTIQIGFNARDDAEARHILQNCDVSKVQSDFNLHAGQKTDFVLKLQQLHPNTPPTSVKI
jgi:hypothetical protein